MDTQKADIDRVIMMQSSSRFGSWANFLFRDDGRKEGNWTNNDESLNCSLYGKDRVEKARLKFVSSLDSRVTFFLSSN